MDRGWVHGNARRGRSGVQGVQRYVSRALVMLAPFAPTVIAGVGSRIAVARWDVCYAGILRLNMVRGAEMTFAYFVVGLGINEGAVRGFFEGRGCGVEEDDEVEESEQKMRLMMYPIQIRFPLQLF